jgi:hypothetical protein
MAFLNPSTNVFNSTTNGYFHTLPDSSSTDTLPFNNTYVCSGENMTQTATTGTA